MESSENDSATNITNVDRIICPCSHRFGIAVLNEFCDSKNKELKYFKHLSGFNSYAKFKTVLEFIVPDLDRKHIVYWSTKKGKEQKVDTSSVFDSDHSDSNSDEDENDSSNDISPPRQHVLSMEDEFLLVMMKLRLGLTNLDIAMRFRISEGTGHCYGIQNFRKVMTANNRMDHAF